MPWIHLPEDDDTAELERTTRPYRAGGRALPGVLAVMKPSPKALRAVMQLNNAVTFGGSRLGRAREELIATSTSALNDCFY